MGVILRSYLVGSPLSWALRVLYTALIVFLIFSSRAAVETLFAAMFMGWLTLMNPGFLQMDKYLRVMPIKARTVVLWEYLYNMAALAFGMAIAVAGVLVFSEDVTVGINFILLLTGVILVAFGGTNLFITSLGRKRWYLAWPMYLIGIVPLYLVFGVSTIHDIIRGRLAGVYVTSSPIFTDTGRWVLFVAIGAAVHVCSYFVAVAVYKKKDYEKPTFWWI